jgi:hypothetical protein
MNSKRYEDIADALFQDNRKAFDAIIKHKSYYLLIALPKRIARTLLKPVLPAIASKQMKSGLWRGKNSAKTAYEILAAIDHAGLTDAAEFKYSPLSSLQNCYDEYALLIKRRLGEVFTKDDGRALAALIQTIAGAQETDGSFGRTVTGTVIHLERLLDLGVSQNDPVIRRGVDYLLEQRKSSLRGMHTSAPYSLSALNVFTTDHRDAEFRAAETYKPDWLPRHICFHTMAMIPNAVCLNLLVRLGLEDDPGVSQALVSLYELYRKHNGLCATNIKKPYL